MPYTCRRRPPKEDRSVAKTDAKCRVGRTYVKRNHEETRRVLRKDAAFDMLRQDDVDRMLSHVNSYPRPSLEGRTPYDEFVSFHGERGREFLDKLNIRRVNPEFVTLDPSLLGPEFKRETDNAILRRKGVIK